MLRKKISIALLMLLCLSAAFSGCNEVSPENGYLASGDITEDYTKREAAEKLAVRLYASRFFRLFNVAQAIYCGETGEYEIFVECVYGEIEGSATILICEDGTRQVTELIWPEFAFELKG